MANEEHLAILKQGVEIWNQWRKDNPEAAPDLGDSDLVNADLLGANLRGADLSRADLSWAHLNRADLGGADLCGAHLDRAHLGQANLSRAILSGANLSWANLEWAHLGRAILSRAHLEGAHFNGANLNLAHLSWANLSRANLEGAHLNKANLKDATILETVFANVDLSTIKDLETCDHLGPSTIDHRTLEKSGELPLPFLRGCGLPESMIEYLPSLRNDPIQFYSCFISYSEEDHSFAERLHADLQAKGVRCWFAREDLKTGDWFRDRIDKSIRVFDKLLLVLSKESIASDWVRSEVEAAFEKERKQPKENKRAVLFPIRLDDAIEQTQEAWAAEIRRLRHILDFSEWETHNSYKKMFDRLLRDLKDEVIAGGAADGE